MQLMCLLNYDESIFFLQDVFMTILIAKSLSLSKIYADSYSISKSRQFDSDLENSQPSSVSKILWLIEVDKVCSYLYLYIKGVRKSYSFFAPYKSKI